MVSQRAIRLMAGSPAIAEAHFRAEAAPYHPRVRLDGYLNLGTAENRLVWDLLQPRLESSRALTAADVRYAPLHGMPELREAVAGFLSRLCRSTVDADDVVVFSGATAALDAIASVLCDAGETIVVPAPYYSAFDTDLAGRSEARLVPAATGSDVRFDLLPGVVDEAISRARRDGAGVRAVALASPSNPVGHVYSAGVLGELADVSRRHDVDLVTDEIYANTVFGPTPFVSLLDPAVNPTHRERSHLVWGFAKDFGLPGLKVGVLYSANNEVVAAARELAYFAPTSTQTQVLLTDLLSDREWLDWFATESRRRLAASYSRCVALLDELTIPHVPAQAGFSAWVDLRAYLAAPSFDAERRLWTDIFERTRVNILPGELFSCPEPGWFRVCHTTDPGTLTEGIARLGRMLQALPAPAGAAAAESTAAVPATGSTGAARGARGSASASPFAAWYEVAGVRSGVRRMFHAELEQGKEFFPAALVPYLGHEAVRALPEAKQRELVIRHLYQFLLSTTHMETRVVNRGAERIANGRAGVDLPPSARMDAFKVYCDEGYHSLYSLDLADQIAAVTKVALPSWDYGGFVERLDQSAQRLLPGEPVLAQLLQVVVFETLITAVLNEVPQDPSVVTAVRDLTRDHARDEGRHHRFFSAFFHRLWTQLDGPTRARAATTLPALIHDCLTLDVEPVRYSLLLAGLDEEASRSVVADCFGGNAGAARIAEIARATVRMCESAGVLDVPGAREVFAEHGLHVIRDSSTDPFVHRID